MEVEMMGKLSEDLVVEIFDRIPIKELTRLKCLSKGWCHSISNYRRTRPRSSNSNLVFQHNSTKESQVIFYNIKEQVEQTAEMVAVETLQNHSFSFSIDNSILLVGSSNGFFLCKKLIIKSEFGSNFLVPYVCNPTLNQWVSLPPLTIFVGRRGSLCWGSYCMGLAFDGVPQHHFKVVKCNVSFRNVYKGSKHISRQIYSSDTGLWKEDKAKFFNSSILRVGGRFGGDDFYFYRKGIAHWQFNGIMLVYHFEKDFFKIFRLPAVVGCLWESEGYLHYCHKSTRGFFIWKFVEDEVFDTQFDDTAKWQHKTTIEFCSLEPQLVEIIGPDSLELLTNMIVNILGIDEDLQILYFAIPKTVISYSFETQRLKKVSTYKEISENRYNQHILWRVWVSIMMQPSGVTLPSGSYYTLLYPKRECQGSSGKAKILLE